MSDNQMTEESKQELLNLLASYNEDDLRVALEAAAANRKTREGGLYFLHYFLGEDRFFTEPTDGRPTISIPLSDKVMNPGKMVHGGITALLCDNAMGMASHFSAQRPGVTLEMTIRYHLPARGKQLTASGEVVHAGGRINSTRCEVRDDGGNLVATATGSFYHGRKQE